VRKSEKELAEGLSEKKLAAEFADDRRYSC